MSGNQGQAEGKSGLVVCVVVSIFCLVVMIATGFDPIPMFVLGVPFLGCLIGIPICINDIAKKEANRGHSAKAQQDYYQALKSDSSKDRW